MGRTRKHGGKTCDLGRDGTMRLQIYALSSQKKMAIQFVQTSMSIPTRILRFIKPSWLSGNAP